MSGSNKSSGSQKDVLDDFLLSLINWVVGIRRVLCPEFRMPCASFRAIPSHKNHHRYHRRLRLEIYCLVRSANVKGGAQGFITIELCTKKGKDRSWSQATKGSRLRDPSKRYISSFTIHSSQLTRQFQVLSLRQKFGRHVPGSPQHPKRTHWAPKCPPSDPQWPPWPPVDEAATHLAN